MYTKTSLFLGYGYRKGQSQRVNGSKPVGPLGLPFCKHGFVVTLIYKPYPNISQTLMIWLIKVPVYTIIYVLFAAVNLLWALSLDLWFLQLGLNFVTVDPTYCISHLAHNKRDTN